MSCEHLQWKLIRSHSVSDTDISVQCRDCPKTGAFVGETIKIPHGEYVSEIIHKIDVEWND